MCKRGLSVIHPAIFFFFVKKKNIYSCQSYFQYWNYSSSPEGNPAATVVFLFCRLKNEKKKKVHIYAYARLVRQEAFEFSTGRTTYLLPNGTSSEMEEESENEVKGRLAI